MIKFFLWFYEGEGSYCYNLLGFIIIIVYFYVEIKKIIYNWRFIGFGDIYYVYDIYIWGLDMIFYFVICKVRILMIIYIFLDFYLLFIYRVLFLYNISIIFFVIIVS